MVDEQYSNIESSQRQSFTSNNCVSAEISFDDQMITSKAENNNTYDTSTSSPESTSENAFNFNGCKFNLSNDDKNSEKKVHWNPSQVHALLDCIEKRMCDFRRKSVHKSVWLAIGKEMCDHGEFTVEHCYNKWKNLRRDIRLFSNTNSMQKLSIRNTYIMERVQRMVNEIGYEGSSRKSSSPISPNFDLVQSSENNGNNNLPQIAGKEFWNSYNQLDSESKLKVENNICNYQNQTEVMSNTKKENIPIQVNLTILNDQNTKNNCNNFNMPPALNNGNIEHSAIEDSIISLLSDPTVSQALIMNPKLLDEILPGLDFVALMKKYSDAHPELVIPTAAVSNTHIIGNSSGMVNNQFRVNKNVSTAMTTTNNSITVSSQKKPVINVQSVSHLSHNNDITNSWPHQLYELLHSFRDEESRQMARLDQIVGYVQVMQDSTKRRLSTINQLISLAGLLIPQKSI